jgi:hypothetical protein
MKGAFGMPLGFESGASLYDVSFDQLSACLAAHGEVYGQIYAPQCEDNSSSAITRQYPENYSPYSFGYVGHRLQFVDFRCT